MADKVTKKSREAAEPVLLSGGNPQIAKADGDAPVPVSYTHLTLPTNREV